MSKIPAAIGPYSAYRRAGDLIITSGQLPIDPEVGKITAETPYDLAKQSLANIAAILEQEGSDMSKVLKCTVYLTDLGTFSEVNRAFEDVFSAPYPARTAIEISKLPMAGTIEIEAIATV